MLIDNSINVSENSYAAKYKFDGIDASNSCGPGSTCEGWTMNGFYSVQTDAFGDHSIEVDSRVKATRDFNKNSMFGMGWGIGYGNDNQQTETFTSIWTWISEESQFGWHNMNLRVPMSQEAIIANPRSA